MTSLDQPVKNRRQAFSSGCQILETTYPWSGCQAATLQGK